MFIRQKKNNTGSISVQVIDKSSGKYCVLKTIGSSSDKAVIKNLVAKARQYIYSLTKQSSIDFVLGDDTHFFSTVYENIQSIQLLGPELVLGKIFDEIGFNKINDELFRHLVIARLVYPVSKLKTLD